MNADGSEQKIVTGLIILKFSVFHRLEIRYITQEESNWIRLQMKNIIFQKQKSG